MRMRVPAAERAFVVELLQAGQPQGSPGFEQMQAACAAGFVQVLGQADSVRSVVDGMNMLNFRTAAQMLGNDVGGKKSIDVPGEWPGIERSAGCSAKRMGQMVL